MSDQNVIGCLARLAMAKNADIQADQFTVYADLLAEVPYDLLKAACSLLSKAQTFGYPTVGDILATCDEIRRKQIAQIRELPAHHDENDRRTWVHCRECNDDPSAWLPSMWCQGAGHGFKVAENVSMKIATCGRAHAHAPHSFTERCGCHLSAWRNEKRMKPLAEQAPDVRERRARA